MIREWLTRLALRTPAIEKLRYRAESAIQESRMMSEESERAVALMGEELRYQRMRMSERMSDLMDLRHAEIACRHGESRAREFSEAWAATPVVGPAQFKERLWELELALEDRGWQREIALSSLEFSRYGVGQLIRIMRIVALKNPLMKRAVEIIPMYVFGRGIEISSPDDTVQAEIDDFIERNQCELGHIGLAEKERQMQTDGALYFGLKTAQKVQIQMIDPLEIMDILTDPDDTSCDWYYRRQWTRYEISDTGNQIPQMMEAYYPAKSVVMDPPPHFKKLDQIGGKPVNWEMPIYRVKAGSSPAKWRWPVPPIYACNDWSRAYKEFLEDWATVNRTQARFALTIETKGGPGAIAAYQALFSTTFADANGTQIERNPPPVVGSAHISGPDNKVHPFRTAGSHTSPEQARRLLLMFCCGAGMPETFTGDASTGSLATALSLDRPTELKFKEIQARWKDIGENLVGYDLWVSSRTPNNAMREAFAKHEYDKPRISFPSVLEHDIGTMVKAWVDIVALGGRQGIAAGFVDRRTALKGMLQEVGYQDVDELLDAIFGTDYDPADDVEDQRTQAAPQNIKGTDPNVSNINQDTLGGLDTPEKGSVAEAVAILRQRISNGRNKH